MKASSFSKAAAYVTLRIADALFEGGPPVAINRFQFQRGLSLLEFMGRYGSEAVCGRALREARWPRGFICPQCAATAHSTFVRCGQRYWQCSAWRMKHKLMEAMTEREAPRQLDGFVEIDDAYLGAERTGGKRGRGPENKRPFVIAVSTNEFRRPSMAAIEPVSGFTAAALTDWARRRVTPDAEVYSDDLRAFRSVEPLGHTHTVIDAGSGRAETEAEGARWANIVRGNAKRALDGTYHASRFSKYAERDLGEPGWRFNRRSRLEALVPRAVVAAARCPGWPGRKLHSVLVFAH